MKTCPKSKQKMYIIYDVDEVFEEEPVEKLKTD